MVTMPRTIKAYCPVCKKHTDQDVERMKKGPKNSLKRGWRRFYRATRGYGGFPRPQYGDREKPTKRINWKFRCKACKKVNQRKSYRARKFELREKA
jgi:large subunit ribosomal protein L44e